MRTARRIALAIFLALIFVAGVSAQDSTKAPSCKVKVRIAVFKWDDGKEFRMDLMSPNQTDWWLKEGQRKFPGVCITTDREADYVVAWTTTDDTTSHSYTVPKTETTHHRGTVNATSTSTGSMDSTNTTGTYSGTSTKTTHEKKEYEWTTTYVNAFVYRPVEVEIDGRKMKKTEGLPLFTAQHKGQWRWSKPDKEALKKSLEYISKQIR